jgi:sugar lactone lactonase YvrE
MPSSILELSHSISRCTLRLCSRSLRYDHKTRKPLQFLGLIVMFLVSWKPSLAQMISVNGAIALPATNVASSSAPQNILLKTTSAETISGFTVPESQGNKQEYTVGTVSGCAVDGVTSNPVGTVCTVPITFSPAYPGQRPVPLQVVTSAGKVNIGLNGTGVAPLAVLTPGTMSTLAGEVNAPNCNAYNGPALLGPTCNPSAGAVDFAGNVFVASFYSNTVSKIDTSGNITVIAGTGAGGLSGVDGPATSATFDRPADVVVDPAGNVYFAVETAEQVLRIDATTQILTSIAGNGTEGYSGDSGPATQASLNRPEGLALDLQGNLYIEDQDNNLIRKVDTSGIITTVAGNPSTIGQGSPTYSGDGGPATQANLALCCEGVYASYDSITVDAAGNLFIGDSGHHVVREVTTDGIIHTVAGNNALGAGFAGDGGAATSAQLNWPMGVAVDPAGDLYIADFSNNRIRKVDAATQTIITVAGSGASSSPDGGPATQVSLNGPQKVALDGEGNLYVADTKNNLVRKVDISNSTLTFATSTPVDSLDTTDGPLQAFVSNIGNAPLALPPPATGSNASVSAGFTFFIGNSGPCPFEGPSSSAGTLAQGSSCGLSVEFEPISTGSITGSMVLTDNSLNAASPYATQTISLAGTAIAATNTGSLTIAPTTQAFSSTPVGSTSSTLTSTITNTTSNAIYLGTGSQTDATDFTQTSNCSIVASNVGTCTVTFTFTPQTAGALTSTYSIHDLNHPSTPLTVVLSGNGTSVTSPQFVSNVGTALAAQAVGVVFANAGTLNTIQVLTQGVAGLDFTSSSGGTCVTGTAYTVGQYCTVNVVFDPQHAGTRSGAVLLLDGSSKTLGIAYLPGTGIGPQIIFDGGSQIVLGGGFSGPQGLGLDGSGNVYVADQSSEAVKQIPLGCVSAGCVKTLASGFMYPTGLSVDGAGNLFFTDFTNSNSSISSSSDNLVEEIPYGCASSSCLMALGSGFNLPDGVGVDVSGNVFVSDWGNNAIKQLVAVNGVIPASPAINVLAGGFTGQTGPDGLVLDASGNIYAANHDNGHALYEIPIGGGYSTLNTISSSFMAPEDAALDGTGNIYVVDETTNALYELPAVGGSLPSPPTINTLANNFNSPEGVVVDALGNIYVADWGNQRVVKIDLSDAPSLSFPTATPVSTPDTTDGPLKVTITNSGNAALTFTGIAASTNFTTDSGITTCSTSIPLAVGSSCVVGVDFAPTAAGSLNGTLTLTDNALNVSGATQSIPLSGTGIAATAPQAVFSPTSLTFTSTIGSASAAQTVTLSNPGNASLTITGVSVAGTNPTDFAETNTCGSTLAAAATCTISVTFTPAATGSVTASLSVVDQAGTQTSTLTGSGVASAPPPAPQATLTATSANFNSVATGSSSAAQTFTLANAGNAALSITSVALTGANASSFTLGADTCGTMLAAGASCTIAVSFDPASAGSFTASLSVTDALGTQTSALSGTGVATSTPADFTIAATPAAQSSYRGAAVNYTIQLASASASNPFTSNVVLTASGLPAGANVAFSPASVVPSSNQPTSAMQITIPNLNARDTPLRTHIPFVGGALAASLFAWFGRRKKIAIKLLLCSCALGALGAGLAGCGNGNGFALPNSTSTIVITGTSGSTTHSTSVTLTIQ